MAQIISTNTTWTTGQVVTLTDTLQVAPGVTLTIQPGVTISGGTIQAFGTVNAVGTPANPITLDAVTLLFGGNVATPGTFNISYVDALNARILPPTGNASYGRITITDSLLRHTDTGGSYYYFWYNEADSSLSRNVFVDVPRLSIGTREDFLVSQNLFVDTRDPSGHPVIDNWAAYGPAVQVHGNSFSTGTRTVISLPEGYTSTKVDASGNFWGTTNLTAIADRILDRTDSLDRASTVVVEPVLTAPDADVPFWGLGTTADSWIGGAAANRAWGNAGSDTLQGNGGNDRLDGGEGIDAAVFAGARASYEILIGSAATSVTAASGQDGVDTLLDIERVHFADKKVALDLDGAAGITAKILGAAFGSASVSNAVYVGVGLQVLDGGATYTQACDLAAGIVGAGLSDSAFVSRIYTNVVGTAPSEGELQMYASMLTSGSMDRAGLLQLAADTALNAARIDLVGLATTGIEFA